MTTLVTTVTETLRYRGKIGQWSWVLHRLSGLGTVLFLALHVVDTSWAAFYPELYADAIAQYQSPLFTIGEFILVACVVYHAFNGLRIVILDNRPELWRYQQRAANYVFLATIIVLIPTFISMFSHVLDFYDQDPNLIAMSKIVRLQSQFALGFVIIVAAAVLLSAVYGAISGDKNGFELPGRVEAMLWSFMRVSGLLIIPLVFGHLAMMHVIQGVFDITHAQITVIGTNLTNETGTAVEFVGHRWDMLVVGVAIWRVYDAGLLALAVIHGFNGVRIVVNDYAHHPIINRGLNYAIIFGTVALIVLGAAALLAGVDETAAELAQQINASLPAQ